MTANPSQFLILTPQILFLFGIFILNPFCNCPPLSFITSAPLWPCHFYLYMRLWCFSPTRNKSRDGDSSDEPSGAGVLFVVRRKGRVCHQQALLYQTSPLICKGLSPLSGLSDIWEAGLCAQEGVGEHGLSPRMSVFVHLSPELALVQVYQMCLCLPVEGTPATCVQKRWVHADHFQDVIY